MKIPGGGTYVNTDVFPHTHGNVAPIEGGQLRVDSYWRQSPAIFVACSLRYTRTIGGSSVDAAQQQKSAVSGGPGVCAVMPNRIGPYVCLGGELGVRIPSAQRDAASGSRRDGLAIVGVELGVRTWISPRIGFRVFAAAGMEILEAAIDLKSASLIAFQVGVGPVVHFGPQRRLGSAP
ncbi:MAG: hypothetical protein B7733_19405 [Myxococcales bacterium FL481]|nr:MAG: hypothetical protein B7733_19405 [Myxococcales bacterium FL481]